MKTVDKKEYIEREALIALFNEQYDTVFVQERTRENKEHWHGVCAGLNWGRNTITDAPTADVVEVRHGECPICGGTQVLRQDCDNGYYVEVDAEQQEMSVWLGDECLAVFSIEHCPNCGAKMDGKGEDK